MSMSMANLTTNHRTALFGARRIGRIHAANIAAHPRCSLMAVVDPEQGAADVLAHEVGSVAMQPAQVLADDRIDPSRSHRRLRPMPL